MSYSGNIIKDLDITRPIGSSEYVSILDDAIREVKRAIVNDKKVTTVSSNYTAQATDSIIICTGTITITLPRQNTVSTPTIVKEYTIINNGSGTITLNPTSPDSVPVTSLPASSAITLIGNGGTAWIEKKAYSSGGGGGLVGGAISSVEHKTSTYTLTNDDKGKLITASGTFTLAIVALSSLDANWHCWINNIGAGVITINPNGSEVIHMPGGAYGGNLTVDLPYSGSTTGPYNINGILLTVNATKTAFLGVATSETHGYYGFGANGTFTVPHGVNTVFVSMSGGGGGGGGGITDSNGGGGGGGAHCILLQRQSVTPGDIINITIGAGGAGGGPGQDGQTGGASSFGSFATCAGGAGGRASSSGGAAGGLGGANGGNGMSTLYGGRGGNGGGTVWGSGGNPTSSNGGNASEWGAGGAGGSQSSSGGNGTKGFCLVRW